MVSFDLSKIRPGYTAFIVSRKYTNFEKSCSTRLISFLFHFGQKMRLTLWNMTFQTFCIFWTSYSNLNFIHSQFHNLPHKNFSILSRFLLNRKSVFDRFIPLNPSPFQCMGYLLSDPSWTHPFFLKPKGTFVGCVESIRILTVWLWVLFETYIQYRRSFFPTVPWALVQAINFPPYALILNFS